MAVDTIERLVDDYCMSCPEDTGNNDGVCDRCHVRKMMDYYNGVDAEKSKTPVHSTEGRKTREDVESLKLNWKSDPCWDIYDTESFEEYRDELTAFQREQEAAWERKRQ